MTYLIIWFVFGLIAALIGSSNEGSGGCGWFIIGVLLGPIGLIFALFAKPQDVMKCPDCAEQIKDDANVCKHCGHRFKRKK